MHTGDIRHNPKQELVLRGQLLSFQPLVRQTLKICKGKVITKLYFIRCNGTSLYFPFPIPSAVLHSPLCAIQTNRNQGGGKVRERERERERGRERERAGRERGKRERGLEMEGRGRME